MNCIDTRFVALWSAGLLLAASFGLGVTEMAGMGKKMDDATVIKSAMSAAPAALSKNATAVKMGADVKAIVVRKGRNGWTCMPDSPARPGPDPMCWDKNAAAWVQAWIGHANPPPGRMGPMYMLEGGTDASNTDPHAQQPTSGNHWIRPGRT